MSSTLAPMRVRAIRALTWNPYHRLSRGSLMSVRPARLAIVAVVSSGALALAGCGSDNPSSAPMPQGSHVRKQAHAPATSAAATRPVITTNVPAGKPVPVDHVVEVSARHATLSSVTVSGPDSQVPGTLSQSHDSWKASAPLEPGTTYTVHSVGRSEDGTPLNRTSHFSTVKLSLDQQTYPSIAPLNGETVGVGMPVIVTFDVPVTDRASIEKHMHVTASSHQQGSWHWLSNQEVHWRPKTYWKPHTDVSVNVDINSVPAGNGIYGQLDRHVDFKVGDAHIYKVNTRTDQMRVFSNGKLLRTLPITTGEQPKYTTRSGVKVIIEKFRKKRMNSETVGIDPNGPDGYDIKGVEYAMRVTYSGEFVHAAPWSVASQGHANVSHGCTGMSTENAHWLYDLSRRGDVVEYTGTDRPMTLTNGYGDWNDTFSQWKAGSALS